MKCPKKEILATLIYIQRLIARNDLILKDTDEAQKVANNISMLFNNALKNVEKAEKADNENNIPIGLNMYAKSVLYTLNYFGKKKPDDITLSSKINLLKDKNFNMDIKYLNKNEVNKNNLTINFGDEDKIYYVKMASALNRFIDDEFPFKKDESFQNLVKIFVDEAMKVNIPVNERDLTFYPIKSLLSKITSFLDAKFYEKKFSKAPLFYSKETEIKMSYLTKKDIKDALDELQKNVGVKASYELTLIDKIIKNNLDDIKDDISDILFAILKDLSNKTISSDLLNILDGSKRFVSSSIPFYLSQYENILKINNTLEFNAKNNNKTIVLPNLVAQKEKEDEDYKPFLELSFFSKHTDKDLPLKEVKEILKPENITYEFDFKKKKIMFKDIDFDKKVNKLYSNNESQNSSYYIKDTYKKDHFYITVIDEVDKGTSGAINKILREIVTDNPEKQVTIASGSPITAKARELVSLLAFGSKGGIDIEENEKNFTIQCGVFELKNEYDSMLFQGVKNSSEISDFVSKAIREYFDKSKDKKSFNEVVFFFNTANTLSRMFGEEKIFDETQIKKFDMYKFSNAISKITKSLMSNKEFFDGNDLEQSFMKVYIKQEKKYLREIPEITNPKSLIALTTSIGKANSSIMTREKLKGIKETIDITDKEDFLEIYKALEETKNENDIEEIYANMSKNNDMSIRFLQTSIDYINQQLFLPQSFEYLKNTFSDFANMFLSDKTKAKNLKNLSKLFDINVNDIENYLNKTTTSGNDDINSIYIQYLKYNGDIEKIEDKFVKDDYSHEKIEFFKKFLKLYDLYFQALPNFLSESTNNVLSVNGQSFVKTGNYKYQAAFKIGEREFDTGNLRTQNGYPKELGILFSHDIELVKEEYKKFLQPIKDENNKTFYIKYNLEFVNPEENTILDVRGSKGISKEIKKEMCENEKSLVISSARVGGLVFNLLDTINNAQFRKNKEKTLSIVVNESSTKDFNLKEIISRIDENYLRNNNIVITPVKRNMLDSQVKLDTKKGYQIALLSNYESISRGLDLSMLDKIIATGGMVKGKEFIQYVARLFSVERNEAEFSLFHGGKDVDLFLLIDKDSSADKLEPFFMSAISGGINDEEANKIIMKNPDLFMPKLTQTARLQLDSLKKLNLYQEVMSGERTNIIDIDTKKLESLAVLTDNSNIHQTLKEINSINTTNSTKIRR